ncbi:MAG: LysM peptidoglycan-binding domain-containing protein, partial [Anaerolineales bacterium]|nr:LysM peptidoglycan-binding domain-containing protein [Anaerolineales bacterium]
MNRSRWIATGLALFFLMVTITAVSAFSYQVRWGDTLSQLAVRFGVSTNDIVDANSKITNPNLIYAGDTIEIPAGDDGGGTGGLPGTYVVVRGDTLFAIARRFNTTIDELCRLNPLIRNKNLIYPGQVINLPGGTGGEPDDNTPPVTSTPFGVGGQIVNFNNVTAMKDNSMTWVKLQYRWTPGDSPSLLAGDIQTVHDNGMKILLSITGNDTFPTAGSIEFDRYVEFVEGVAALGPDAIEIWNEMNLDREWPAGEINPATY